MQTRGWNILSSAASSVYTLAAPPGPGVRCAFTSITTSTALRQITSAVNIVRGVASSLDGGDAGIQAASSAYTIITLQGQGNVVELVGLSTAAWLCNSIAGYTSAPNVNALTTV